MGRGLAKMEYTGFRQDMNEARERFDEAALMITKALETGVIEGDGPVLPAATRRAAPQAVALVQGPHLLGGHVARLGRCRRRARRRA